jgi:hypothetical protein
MDPKASFREAAKEAAAREEDAPQPRRRGKKDGERDGGMMRPTLRFARALTTQARPKSHTGCNEMREDFRNECAALTASRGDGLRHESGFRLDGLDPESAGSLCSPLAFGGGDLGFSEDFDAGTEYSYDGL